MRDVGLRFSGQERKRKKNSGKCSPAEDSHCPLDVPSRTHTIFSLDIRRPVFGNLLRSPLERSRYLNAECIFNFLVVVGRFWPFLAAFGQEAIPTGFLDPLLLAVHSFIVVLTPFCDPAPHKNAIQTTKILS